MTTTTLTILAQNAARALNALALEDEPAERDACQRSARHALTELITGLGRRSEASRARSQRSAIVNAPASEIRAWATAWNQFVGPVTP